MKPAHGNQRHSRSIASGCLRLLLELTRHPEGRTVPALLRKLGFSRPTLYRRLADCEAAGWRVEHVHEGQRVILRLGPVLGKTARYAVQWRAEGKCPTCSAVCVGKTCERCRDSARERMRRLRARRTG